MGRAAPSHLRLLFCKIVYILLIKALWGNLILCPLSPNLFSEKLCQSGFGFLMVNEMLFEQWDSSIDKGICYHFRESFFWNKNRQSSSVLFTVLEDEDQHIAITIII